MQVVDTLEVDNVCAKSRGVQNQLVAIIPCVELRRCSLRVDAQRHLHGEQAKDRGKNCFFNIGKDLKTEYGDKGKYESEQEATHHLWQRVLAENHPTRTDNAS